MIREAVPGDIPRLVAMGGRFIRIAYPTTLRDNPAARAETMAAAIAGENGLLLVMERCGQIVGMICAFVYVHPLTADKIGGELFWWVEPECRGRGLALLRRAEAWAKTRGAIRFTSIAPSARTARLYRHLGYQELEVHYQKDI